MSSSSVPTEKDRKYDRQLRLWASSGQHALENAHVCLIGATATGSEILKNLVLPGIGQFTVVDGGMVNENDVASNFFVSADEIGKSRAECVRALINELNPEVRGHAIASNPSDFISKHSLEEYSLVIACNVNPSDLATLSTTLYERNVPLAVADSVGFYGYFRVVFKEHTVIETHPDSLVELRLDRPWKELQDYANSFNLEYLSPSDLAHVPYVILLLIHIQKWRNEHNGNLPKDLDEKRAFKQQIADAKGSDDPENFDEAVAAVWRLATPSGIPSYKTEELFKDRQLSNISNASPFWVLVAALKEYLKTPESEGLLPLPGVLPDMKADTKGFVTLQNLYRERAKKDLELFENVLHGLIKENNLSVQIPHEMVLAFCKNAKFATALKGSPLELDGSKSSTYAYDDDKEDLFHIYVATRAYKSFLEANGHPPGLTNENDDLTTEAQKVVQSFGYNEVNEATQNVLKEVVRCAGAELQNIAALLGGVGGQEVIKLITHQYLPLDNTLIFDGISSKTAAFRF
jgi:amyloid beta precursor protein binding protein 1